MGWDETTIIHPAAWSDQVEHDLAVGLFGPVREDWPEEWGAACDQVRAKLAELDGPQVVTLAEAGITVVPAVVPTVEEHAAREAALEQVRAATQTWADAIAAQYPAAIASAAAFHHAAQEAEAARAAEAAQAAATQATEATETPEGA